MTHATPVITSVTAVTAVTSVTSSGADVKMDESSLTGEPEPQVKDPVNKPFIVSGTAVTSGSGRMLVIAVRQRM